MFTLTPLRHDGEEVFSSWADVFKGNNARTEDRVRVLMCLCEESHSFTGNGVLIKVGGPKLKPHEGRCTFMHCIHIPRVCSWLYLVCGWISTTTRTRRVAEWVRCRRTADSKVRGSNPIQKLANYFFDGLLASLRLGHYCCLQVRWEVWWVGENLKSFIVEMAFESNTDTRKTISSGNSDGRKGCLLQWQTSLLITNVSSTKKNEKKKSWFPARLLEWNCAIF